MANICDTTFVIEGSKEEVQNLANKLAFWTSDTNPYNVSLREKYRYVEIKALTFIAKQALIVTNDTRRGVITDMDLELEEQSEDTFTIRIETDSAWTAPVDFMNALVGRYAPNCKIYFQSTEPGCDYYVIQDDEGKYFDEDIIVDAEIEQHAEEFKAFDFPKHDVSYYTEEDFLAILQKGFNDYDSDFDTLLEKLNKMSQELTDGDEFLTVAKYTRVSSYDY